ncbi:prepilin-type N-terminal cleavage/methylation domain-containing protein [Kineococcus rubinsiae]|uniref:prepilin-type N-terminal cleavage/methylation domain-containing protein n=1 Tax=Kineococcus rubinsiae TaxID=2609562 RepID=UPI001431E437|nr:prepilin-type N-terminal cleavage/methylation domain-containing protein [Kineococcus rubinsiae]
MRERAGDDEGFTLLEVVIALVLFGIVASATAAVLVRGVAGSSDNRARAAAANIAAQTMDTLRQSGATGQGYTGLATRQLGDVVVQGRTYSVFASVTAVRKANAGSPCAAGGLSDEIFKKVGVTVTWPASGSVQPVRSDTIVQNPGVAADLTKGAVGVVVAGPAAQPQPRVPVTLSSGATQVTDDSGCAYFSGLPAGNYTATATAPGYVNPSGGQSATQTAGVVAASATVVNLTYAKAATPRITFGTAGPNGTLDPAYVFYGTPGFTLNSGTSSFPGTTSTGVVTPVLYPAASGYETWLGGCVSEAPTSRVSFTTLPGASPQVTVPAGGLTLRNTGAASVSILLQHTDSSCATSYTGTLPPGATYRVTVPFGQWAVTSPGGAVVSPAAVSLTDGAPTGTVTVS